VIWGFPVVKDFGRSSHFYLQIGGSNVRTGVWNVLQILVVLKSLNDFLFVFHLTIINNYLYISILLYLTFNMRSPPLDSCFHSFLFGVTFIATNNISYCNFPLVVRILQRARLYWDRSISKQVHYLWRYLAYGLTLRSLVKNKTVVRSLCG